MSDFWRATCTQAKRFLGRDLGITRRRRRADSSPIRSEALEVRQLLTAVPWENPSQLTSSIVPDGTDVEGQPSTFLSTYSYLGTPVQLRRAIGEVFQAWTSQVNVNIGFVPDGGQPLGIQGQTQGDSRFGDIRIAAVPMSSEVYAFAVPHSGGIAGTWAGDIVFNSTFRPATLSQLKSVLMHEVGHILGLTHSPNVVSPMYLHNSPSTPLVPAAEDVAKLIQLHGTRIDAQDAKKANDTISNASDMRTSSFDGLTPLMQYGDISKSADIDYFQLNALSDYSGPVTVRLRIHGLSQLKGSLAVVSRNGSVISAAVSTTPGGDAIVNFQQVAEQKYYIRITSATGAGAFGIGRYAVVVTYDRLNKATRAAIESVPQMNVDFLDQAEISELFLTGRVAHYENDLHLNDTLKTATTLKSSIGYAKGTAYGYEGTISDLTDIDFYSFRSPERVAAGDVMVVSFEVADYGTLIPKLSILNSAGQAVPFTVLRSGAGRFTVQVSGIVAQRDYFLKVQRDPATTRNPVGNYSFRVRFGAFAEEMTELFRGRLTAAAPRKFHEVEMTQTRLLAISLTPINAAAASANVATQLTIFDAAGNEIYRIVSIGGATRTADTLLLKAGTYFVRFNATTKDGKPLPIVDYKLSAVMLSDDTGPLGTDPTDAPPIDAKLVDVVVISNPTTTPPPTLGNPPKPENPWIYQPNPYEDWYWFFGVM